METMTLAAIPAPGPGKRRDRQRLTILPALRGGPVAYRRCFPDETCFDHCFKVRPLFRHVPPQGRDPAG